jgi:membrane protein DedA with SNARE-associated domain
VGDTVDFLLRHGHVWLFAVVLGEQLGLPLLGAPVLLAAGALAAADRLSAGGAVALAVVACLLGDSLWYELGRRRGVSVLAWLCRISLEPAACVRRTAEVFGRHGARTLLVAKFVPGLNAVAPPLSGAVRIPYGRFVAYDAGGSVAWAGAYVALGYVFASQLGALAVAVSRLGTGLGLVAGVVAVTCVGWRWWERRRLAAPRL